MLKGPSNNSHLQKLLFSFLFFFFFFFLDYHQNSHRMAGARVWVDDQLCYSFPNSNDTEGLDTLPEKLHVHCSQPWRGQALTITKDGDDAFSQFYILNLCEVQVWGQCSPTCVFFLSYLSRSLADRWGTTEDFTTSFLHFLRVCLSACNDLTMM